MQPSARQQLLRADSVIGLLSAREKNQVLRYRATTVRSWAYQSDKQYAPYLFSSSPSFEWFSPSTGALASSGQVVAAGAHPHDVGFAYASFGPAHDTLNTLSGDVLTDTRNLNPWATITDWLNSANVRVAGSCVYREYPRNVLARRSVLGDEYLLLDQKTGFPVKLDRTEHHYLWGDTHVEYIYATWSQAARSYSYFPVGSFRIVDGEQDAAWMSSGVAVIAADSAPDLSVADTSASAALEESLFLRALPVDTVRIGPQSFLLENYGYTHAVDL
jgi:hypothetical protein